MAAELNAYTKHGFETREKYLKYLSAEHGVPEETVCHLAKLYGPAEDFDGLLVAIANDALAPVEIPTWMMDDHYEYFMLDWKVKHYRKQYFPVRDWLIKVFRRDYEPHEFRVFFPPRKKTLDELKEELRRMRKAHILVMRKIQKALNKEKYK